MSKFIPLIHRKRYATASISYDLVSVDPEEVERLCWHNKKEKKNDRQEDPWALRRTRLEVRRPHIFSSMLFAYCGPE